MAQEEVYAALLDVVVLGVPFVQALVARGAATGENVERELARIRVPALRLVRVADELARKLPPGLCERLLAVPVGSSPNGEAEVACVDPLDSAVGDEFSFHLGVPARLVRAPLSAVLLGIERWLDERDAAALRSTRTPAFGTAAARRPSSSSLEVARPSPVEPERGGGDARPAEERQSAPPFPLVRRSIVPSRVRVDTNPGVGGGRALSVPFADEQDESGEPIIGLTRSKPPPPVEREPRAKLVLEAPNASVLDRVESADELVRSVADLAAPLAQSVWVFAMKTGVNEVRAVRPSLGERALLLKLAAVERCVLDVAVQDGHYLGRLPDDEVHRELRSYVGDVEVYAVPVLVTDRPALGLLLAGLGSTLGATRAGDEIARRAGVALARILLNKKRG